MYEIFPYFTNDGSVGLFSPQDDDIYHSTLGALSEAYEKFILPANFSEFFLKNKKIKILDICYGIGYNSKSFLNYFFENFVKKYHKKNMYIDTIGNDNILEEIFIKAIEIDKKLIELSPFFKTGKKIFFNKNLSFENKKIEHFLKKETKPKYKIKKIVNLIILNKIIEKCPEILDNDELAKTLKSKKYRKYFDKFMTGIFDFYRNRRYKQSPLCVLSTLLHNIYYTYLSTSYKKALNYLKLGIFDFDLSIHDARSALKNDTNLYNFVFLDAFTPAKCPCLWTVDFFKLIFNHLDNDGIVLTYSNSSAVRNAFLNAGFFVGKIYNETEGKFTGTVAVKNKLLIKTPLSEYDLGLMKTKAGIFYRDKELSLDNKAIINEHTKEVEKSTLQTSSQFIKQYRGKK